MYPALQAQTETSGLAEGEKELAGHDAQTEMPGVVVWKYVPAPHSLHWSTPLPPYPVLHLQVEIDFAPLNAVSDAYGQGVHVSARMVIQLL